MALLTDFETLAKLTSVGTMFVTGMVAACLIWRRYYNETTGNASSVLGRLLAVLAASFGAESLLVSLLLYKTVARSSANQLVQNACMLDHSWALPLRPPVHLILMPPHIISCAGAKYPHALIHMPAHAPAE